MTDRLILVGRIAGAFGVRGELRLASYTEDPMALTRYRVLFHEDGAKALTLTGGRPVKGGIVARAAEVADRNAAEALRGVKLYLPREALPPPEEDEFYLADLIGLVAETPEGERLGLIKAVHDFGAGDLLEIQPDQGPSWWLPFTRDAVPEVRIADGRIVAVRPEEAE
ncbi:MAG: ribosome maturation factor RimM [Phenylobacterium sp.]